LTFYKALFDFIKWLLRINNAAFLVKHEKSAFFGWKIFDSINFINSEPMLWFKTNWFFDVILSRLRLRNCEKIYRRHLVCRLIPIRNREHKAVIEHDWGVFSRFHCFN
jgi:hypothetical protein